MRALLLLLLIACGNGKTKQVANPPPPVTADAAVAARSEVTTVEQLKAGPADVIGTARNAKLAAAIVVGGTPVYCMGVDSWPSDVANKQVVARGTLEETDEFHGGIGEAGTTGNVWVIRGCTYETR